MAAVDSAWDTGTGAVKTLDLRALPAPEPLVRALAAADVLQPGRTEVLTPLLPTPLLDALDARGLRWRSEPCADGGMVAMRGPRNDGLHNDGGA